MATALTHNKVAAPKASKPLKFFVPGQKKSQYEVAYQAIMETMKDQLRWPVGDHRIYSLDYTHDKKQYTLEVGKPTPLDHRYEVVAILDSSVYVVMTRAVNGGHGLTVLVSKDEVTAMRDFD